MTTALRLAEITPDNFDAAIGLKVRSDQEHFVAPVVQSLAEAYVHSDKAWPRLILDGDQVVGFSWPSSALISPPMARGRTYVQASGASTSQLGSKVVDSAASRSGPLLRKSAAAAAVA